MNATRSVVSVSHLSKKLCRDLRRARWYGLRDIASEWFRPTYSASRSLRRGEFWALDDVSFEVAPGESLAVVGGNGAGKSTLLKVLYGLVKPDAGRVRTAGRLAALIELGTGFNPVLTGRENVLINAALHGMPRRDAHAMLDGVEAFAGLGDAISAPLQFYSSGMQARLAYAVAAHLRPDVLLVDEVLAVGDLAFQRKCLRHMRQYVDGGGSLVFVSHNTYQVQAICSRGILLEQGRVKFAGSAVDTLGAHLESQQPAPAPANGAGAPAAGASDLPVVIDELSHGNPRGGEPRAGEPLRLALRYRAHERVTAFWTFSIWTADLLVCITGKQSPESHVLEPGRGELRCEIPRLPMLAGSYLLRAILVEADTNCVVATFGWDTPPSILHVHEPPSVQRNQAMAANMLMTVDVNWDVA